ncbi:ATP-binding protein [Tumidithrix elongata RA019]|uniref:Circadian input-output histidine kinase CikA n=1 Tax=Tumidithrix elongata BACA0141 TaxID=2716417 RepID=A0AAW9PRN8_9CYAN|nr:ATP-binding protein [Tumidithrix elongata RA019]
MTVNLANNALGMPFKSVKFGLHSIGTRLFLAVMAAASVGLGSLGYLFYNELKSVRILQLTSETDTRVRQLDSELLSGESFLKSLAAATTFLHDSGVRSPEDYEKLVLSFMPARPKLISGFGIMQLPRGLVDREWFAPYIEESVPNRGVKLPEDPRFSLVELWQVDKYPELQYFKDAVKADRYFWSKPYINEAIYPIPLMTFAGTIRDRQGKLIAVMNGDINVKDLNQTKDGPLFDDTGYYALIAPEGGLLSYSPDPTKAVKLENVSSIPALKPAWDRIQRELDKGNEKGYLEFDSTYWVYQKVPSSQWVMLQAIPYQIVVRPALLGAISATIVAGFFLVLVVWLFIRFLNRRLQPILDVCDRAIDAPNRSSVPKDEISRLSDAFFSMVNRQNLLLEELQRTNAQLIESNRLKDSFLANMSHELRTPLNAILGMTEILQEEVFGTVNDRQIKALKTVERSGYHLLELINDILDIAKIESGHLDLDLTSISVVPLCRSSLELIEKQALKKNIQLEFKLPDNLPNIYGDERRIRQVLLNLLNNAVKFTPEEGRVTLEVKPTTLCDRLDGSEKKPERSAVQFAITDTGIGIAPENISRLFQPFIQIDSALNRKYEGTGLGLALVKRIVELHRGEVSLSSELGVGSCFAFVLPCDAAATTMPTQETQPNLKASQPQPEISPLVLIVDDNAAIISSVASYLTVRGYRMVLAKNAREAIDLAKTQPPNLVVIDVQTLGRDGMDEIEAIEQFCLDLDLDNFPIVALIDPNKESDRDRCLEAGASEYLTKPVKLRELAATIQRLLNLVP